MPSFLARPALPVLSYSYSNSYFVSIIELGGPAFRLVEVILTRFRRLCGRPMTIEAGFVRSRQRDQARSEISLPNKD
jgi:hypothetical protein